MIPDSETALSIEEIKPAFCVVDDETEVCDIFRLFFESRGHTCYIAHNGREGLKLIREERPAAVFLDVQMPEMNGFDVLLEIRKDPDIHKIPVMLMTGLTKESEFSQEEWAKTSGADAFLHKPFDFEDLLAIVEKLTGVRV